MSDQLPEESFGFPPLVAKCPNCGRQSTENMIGRSCRMTQPIGPPCTGILFDMRAEPAPDPFTPLHLRGPRSPENTEDEPDTGVVDDLDLARQCLKSSVDTLDEGVSDSLRAIAHVMLWQAEQQRNYQRQHAEAQRLAKEWRESQPPPPSPPPPLPAFPFPGYQGF